VGEEAVKLGTKRAREEEAEAETYKKVMTVSAWKYKKEI